MNGYEKIVESRKIVESVFETVETGAKRVKMSLEDFLQLLESRVDLPERSLEVTKLMNVSIIAKEVTNEIIGEREFQGLM